MTAKHRCPSWCHRCPDLVEIVRERGGDVDDPFEVTMPGCMGGAVHGGCHCQTKPDRRSIASRSERVALMRELIAAYPAQARQMVADLAPPREQKPTLRIIEGQSAS